MPTRVLVPVLPGVHLLDLGGPIQTLYEANGFVPGYQIVFCGLESEVESAQGLTLARLGPLPEAREGDLVLIAGIDSERLDSVAGLLRGWLRQSDRPGVRFASICSAAFVLGEAGLLEGRQCTTHWKILERLQQRFHGARVQQNRLFVEDGPIVTSAGEASGIDLALSLVEQDHGPLVTAAVAREMVVWLRRDGSRSQRSIYLDYRTHLHPGVHRVQDWLVAHPDEQPTLDQLAALAGMSARNLTRLFREATGITLKEFANRIKLEVAANLLHNPEMTLERIAAECGFKDPRQLRRLWRETHGESPSASRQRGETRGAA